MRPPRAVSKFVRAFKSVFVGWKRRQLTFLVRLPLIPVAYLTPKLFLAAFHAFNFEPFSRVYRPMARYCRSRLMRTEQAIIQHHNQGSESHFDVTIVITSYNYQKFISQAILSANTASIYASTRGIQTNIVVVDDSSTDTSKPTIEELVAKIETPTTTVYLPLNCGPAYARNVGVENGPGRFILFLDADNTLTETAVQDLHATILDTDAAAVYGQVQIVDFVTGELGERFSSEPYNLNQLLQKGNYIDTMALYRRETLISIGGFSQSMQLITQAYEDYELWVTLGEKGCSVLNIPRITGKYLMKEDSLIATGSHDERIIKLLLNLRHLHPRLGKFIFR
jgi:cellulose synthase/poly-beta-1,6-N-acetylglucosamine synthase-like glycosyltransferase